MSQIHVVIRRISPALKIDLVQIGRFDDHQFEPLPLSAVADSPIVEFLRSSPISDSPYIDHSEITALIASCGDLPCFSIEFSIIRLFLHLNLILTTMKARRKKKGKGTKIVTRPLGGRVL